MVGKMLGYYDNDHIVTYSGLTDHYEYRGDILPILS